MFIMINLIYVKIAFNKYILLYSKKNMKPIILMVVSSFGNPRARNRIVGNTSSFASCRTQNTAPCHYIKKVERYFYIRFVVFFKGRYVFRGPRDTSVPASCHSLLYDCIDI